MPSSIFFRERSVQSSPETYTWYAVKRLMAAYHIPITQTAMQENLAAHPAYPAPGSILSALEQWHVSHMLVQLEEEHLAVMDYPALAWVQKWPNKAAVPICLMAHEGEFVYIEEPTGGVQELRVADFSAQWTGLTLLAEQDEQAGDPAFEVHRAAERKQQQQHRFRWMAGGLVCLLMALAWSAYPAYWSEAAPWLVLKLLGGFVSLFLLRNYMDETESALDKWCYSGGEGDCAKVLTSPMGKLLKELSLTELASWYFIGGLAWVAISPFTAVPEHALPWIWAIGWCGAPVILYSLIVQGFTLRKACTYCLMLSGIWAGELILGWIQGLDVLLLESWQGLLPGLMGFILLSLAWSYIKPRWKDTDELAQTKGTLRAYRKLPALFEEINLRGQSIAVGKFPLDICWGNAESGHELFIYLDPLCGPCLHKWEQTCQLMRFMGDRLLVRVRFYAAQPAVSGMDIAARVLHEKLRYGPDAARHLLTNWFARGQQDEEACQRWLATYPANNQPYQSEINEQFEATRAWAADQHLPGVPYACLNGQLVQAEQAFFEDLECYLRQQG